MSLLHIVLAGHDELIGLFQVKSYNGRNRFILPLIVRIPYYIWIGCSRKRDTSRFVHAFEIEGGNMLGNCSPAHDPTVPVPTANPPDLDLGPAALGDLPRSIPKKKSDIIVNVTPPLRYIQRTPDFVILPHPSLFHTAHSIINSNTYVEMDYRYIPRRSMLQFTLALASALL